MTTKQFTLIAKELLPDLPGFVVDKSLVFKTPVADVLHGLYFERSADVSCFYVSVFFLPLFVPTDLVHGTYGKRIGNALDWRLDNPSLLADLRVAIHVEGLPFLDSVATLAGVLHYLNAVIERGRPRVNSHILEALAYTLIKAGDYSAALKALAEQQRLLDKATIPWVIELKARAELVQEKLLLKPKEALAQLEVWRAETVSNLGLQKYC
jgi:hypothetical protein